MPSTTAVTGIGIALLLLLLSSLALRCVSGFAVDVHSFGFPMIGGTHILDN